MNDDFILAFKIKKNLKKKKEKWAKSIKRSFYQFIY